MTSTYLLWLNKGRVLKVKRERKRERDLKGIMWRSLSQHFEFAVVFRSQTEQAPSLLNIAPKGGMLTMK